MKSTILKIFAAAMLTGAAIASAPQSEACTRVVYKGTDNLIIVGRSLDWKTPIPTNIYVYPAGITKKGNVQENSVTWTSKYGAVYAVSYDGGVTEGMNEKGLVVNGLFCKGTVYDNDSTMDRPPMSLAMFPAWLLDMNATVPEVIEKLREQDFNITGATFDGGTVSALHWGVTDAEGRTCIFEFDHGKINIYEGEDIRTLTNDPDWPSMQAINNYWKAIGGVNMLPGTVRSADRYVRTDFFIRNVEQTSEQALGVSITRSVVENASVPYLYTVNGEPNVSSTQWRTFADIRDKCYYFDLVTNPGLYYIDLKEVDLRPGAPILKIDNAKSGDLLGNATSKMKRTKGLTPMY